MRTRTFSQAQPPNAPSVHPRSWRHFLLKHLPVTIALSAESTLRDADRRDTAYIDSAQDAISAIPVGSVDPLWYPEDRASLKRPRYVQKYTRDNAYSISASAADDMDTSGSVRVMRRWEKEPVADEKKRPQLWTLWDTINDNNRNDECMAEPVELTVGARRGSNDSHAKYSGQLEGNFGRVGIQTSADGKSKLALRTRQLLGLEFGISGKIVTTKRAKPRHLFDGTELRSAEVGVRCAQSGRNLVFGGAVGDHRWYVETRPFRNSSIELDICPADTSYKIRCNKDLALGVSGGYHRPHLSIRRLTVRHNELEYEAASGKWDTTVSRRDVTVRIRCADGRGRLKFELGRDNRSAMECSVDNRDAELDTLQSRLLARIDSERGVSVRFGRFY